ncbi:DMT family transporter [Hahella ganghwensis]|uniref:DMT family transporter n=1 Tax=Hahella ganghwensis TaxID=286420 RepID=UPI00037CDBE5|nr:DMT family transporter [Hahella ganghwensis]
MKTLKAEILLILAAAIWGMAFVAQVKGMDHVGPFTFNAARFLIGALSLIPLLFILPRFQRIGPGKPASAGVVTGGILAGAFLFAGASLQQVGLQYTTAGKAGFITGLYIVIVPMIALMWGQRALPKVWIGALMAVLGLYFLSIREDFSLSYGDSLQLVGAFFWAGHVLIVGWLSPRYNPIHISIVQFFACGLLSWLIALGTETLSSETLIAAAGPIAYGGLMSVGVAFTLQVVGQQWVPASHAAIIISLEAVFAAIGGWWLLNEHLDGQSLFGCGLMLVGMVVSQWPTRRKRETTVSVDEKTASGMQLSE